MVVLYNIQGVENPLTVLRTLTKLQVNYPRIFSWNVKSIPPLKPWLRQGEKTRGTKVSFIYYTLYRVANKVYFSQELNVRLFEITTITNAFYTANISVCAVFALMYMKENSILHHPTFATRHDCVCTNTLCVQELLVCFTL